MRSEHKRILRLLDRGKISVDEAERLIAAVEGNYRGRDSDKKPRYLHVIVEKDSDTRDRVNVRIPIRLLGHGLKLTKLIPSGVRGKIEFALSKVGMNFEITEDNIAEFVDALSELSVEIDGGEKVQVCCK